MFGGVAGIQSIDRLSNLKSILRCDHHHHHHQEQRGIATEPSHSHCCCCCWCAPPLAHTIDQCLTFNFPPTRTNRYRQVLRSGGGSGIMPILLHRRAAAARRRPPRPPRQSRGTYSHDWEEIGPPLVATQPSPLVSEFISVSEKSVWRPRRRLPHAFATGTERLPQIDRMDQSAAFPVCLLDGLDGRP
jgi:hypothetical protein